MTPSSTPSKALLADFFRRANLPLTDTQVNLFWAYHQLLRHANEELNMTRLHAFDTIVIKHYIDCALITTLTELPSPLIDIGSGAGFPGIPIKIMRPDLHVILAEGRKNRVEFLRMVISELKMEGIDVHSGRIYPDTCMSPPVQCAITRAVEPMTETLSRVSGCLSAGGKAMFMKGPDGATEIADVQTRFPDYTLHLEKHYRLPFIDDDRLLISFERISQPHQRPKPPVITSDDNAAVKRFATLQTAKGIKKAEEYLVGGAKVVSEMIQERPDQITAWIGTPDTLPPPAAIEHAHWIVVSKERFNDINAPGTPAPLLTIRLPTIPDFDPHAPWPTGCTLFVPFGDPENVGAVIRAAAGLGAARVVLLQEAAFPFLPRAIRAAAGAVHRIRMELGPSLKELLTFDKPPLFVLDTSGTPLDTVTPPETFGLIAGMEGQGVPDSILQRATAVSIPLQNGVESLNAAAASAIALWTWRDTSTPFWQSTPQHCHIDRHLTGRVPRTD